MFLVCFLDTGLDGLDRVALRSGEGKAPLLTGANRRRIQANGNDFQLVCGRVSSGCWLGRRQWHLVPCVRVVRSR